MSDDDLNELDEKMGVEKKKMEKLQKLTSLAAGMVSSIALVLTITIATGLFFGKSNTLSREELTSKIIEVDRSNRQQLSDIASIKSDLAQMKKGLQSVSSLPKGSEWKAEISKLSHQVSNISERMTALESALTVDPSKALSVPILRKDLDSAEKNLRSELTQTRSEINRIYDQNKWFIGLMFTIALSVLGMAVSSMFNRKDT